MVPVDKVVPLLLFDNAETLDLREVDLVKSAPRPWSSVVMRVGDSVVGTGISAPEVEDESVSASTMDALAGEDWDEGITLAMEAERAEKADEEGARSRPRPVLTTSWTWRLSGFFDAVGGGLTIMYV